MADAIPVTRQVRAAPSAKVSQEAVDEVKAMRAALVVSARPEDDALVVIAEKAVSEGKNVMSYPNMVRVDH